MANPKAHKEYNTFVKGLITEASDLNFPENYSVDEDNCLLNRDGSRQRRQGMDYEDDYVLSPAIPKEMFEDEAISVIEWKHAANNGLFNFVIIQLGTTLYIHDMADAAIGAVKATIDLTEFETPLASNFGYEPIQGTSGNGFLFCTSKDTDPFYIKYEPHNDDFVAVPINLQIRDFLGVQDGAGRAQSQSAWKLYWTELAITIFYPEWFEAGKTVVGDTSGATAVITQLVTTNRNSPQSGYMILKDLVGTFTVAEELRTPTSATLVSMDTFNVVAASTDERTYNLRNQGWRQADIDTYTAANGVPPDHSQIWHLGKDSSDDFDAALLDKQGFGSTPAPTGHYIIDAFNTDRAAVSGISVESEFSTLEKNRPTTAAFFAGRVFYSGVESTPAATASSSPLFINCYIYFSQILESISKAGFCYQDADPTSEHISDLVETDGGTIQIPEVGKILRLEVVDKFLIVIANNGVWSISGLETGFSPTNYTVSKITNVGALGPSSIVEAEGVILYWAEAGIYALTQESVSQAIKATNITEQTIHSYYTDIKTIARTLAEGKYDAASRQIRWLYNDETTYNGNSSRQNFAKELVYDTVLGAFYPSTVTPLASDSPFLAGILSTPNLLTNSVITGVVVGTDSVLASGEAVQITTSVPGEGTTSIKYLAVEPQSDGLNHKYCFSRYNNATFLDWVEADDVGIDYSSFLLTGFELLGDSSRDKHSTYITVHSELSETGFAEDINGDIQLENPSSLLLQGRWGWSDHSDSGRWSRPQQVYRFNRNYIPSGASDAFNYGFRVVTTKNKIRGHGKALSLYFYSETGKDFKLLGWANDFTGEETT